MSIILRCYDLAFFTCEFLTIPSLVSLSQTSHSSRHLVAQFIQLLIRKSIKKYHPYPHELLHNIDLYSAAVGQDIALEVALHGLPSRHIEHQTLTIYVPNLALEVFCKIFFEKDYIDLVEWRSPEGETAERGLGGASYPSY